MMTCREVSMLVSTGQLAGERLSRRLAVWLHLAMCQHCRRFRRQLEALAGAARRAGSTFEREPPRDWEDHLTQVVGRGTQRGQG